MYVCPQLVRNVCISGKNLFKLLRKDNLEAASPASFIALPISFSTLLTDSFILEGRIKKYLCIIPYYQNKQLLP